MEQGKISDSDSDADGVAAARKKLLARIARNAAAEGRNGTPIPGLLLYRHEHPTPPAKYMQEPGICLIAQGAKRLLLNKDVFQNDPDHYLLTVLDVPVVTEIVGASPEKPYLALALNIDFRIISELMLDDGMPAETAVPYRRAMAISGTNLPLLNAFNRLLDLYDEPDNAPVLAPLAQREILFRLLISEQGPFLRKLALAGSQNNQIARAVEWLKSNYDKPLRVDDLASYSRMSTSTFHHHFRELTAMSPLQYQKHLRLQEARRLMLAERMDAANAAFRVGYESPSQFSREYSRMFDAPPARDIKTLLKNMKVS